MFRHANCCAKANCAPHRTMVVGVNKEILPKRVYESGFSVNVTVGDSDERRSGTVVQHFLSRGVVQVKLDDGEIVEVDVGTITYDPVRIDKIASIRKTLGEKTRSEMTSIIHYYFTKESLESHSGAFFNMLVEDIDGWI